ncbi:MAG: amino acid adenylation domain-containing protein [Clostridioides sp.]|jgi:amino acid adenylation domain-containing protein|nr:amino acid adenylation domain-containing protein [Clostridioides sp.]
MCNHNVEPQYGYWSELLRNYTNFAKIPYDYFNKDYERKMTFETRVLDENLLNKLADYSKASWLELESVFETIFGLVLQKYIYEEDVVFGRGRSEIPIRIDGSEGDFLTLVNKVQTQWNSSQKHLDTLDGYLREECILGEKLINTLVLHEDLSEESIVNALKKLDDDSAVGEVGTLEILDNESSVGEVETLEELNYNNAVVALEEMDNDERLNSELSSLFGKYDLTMILSGEMFAVFNESLYDRSTIKRLMGVFKEVVEQVISNDELKINDELEIYDGYKCVLNSKPIKDIEFISKREKDRILEEFNDTEVDIPLDKTYIDLYRESVRNNPDNIAVSDEQGFLTYREFDKITEKLAGYLNFIGAGIEDVVAVILPRNLSIVVSAISIMKAGCSFFPIDINNPKERMEYLIEDSKAKVVVTYDHLNSIVDFKGATIVDIDGMEFMDKYYPVISGPTPTSNAYTISTSGSTGRPKIIEVEHRSLVNMCYFSIDSINITEEDVCGVYLSFSFDAVMKQIFPYLMVGASVNIMPEEAKYDEYTVNEYCSEEDVTVLALPSAMAKLFIKNCNSYNLRVLQAGGERLKGYKDRKYKIYNEYGPAEFTVISTMFNVDRRYDRIPIGKPIYNTYAYVLDKNGNLCPPGMPGELCLSGVQMSRGYMNNEEKSRQCFIENPFAVGENTRLMYKTGDLVRWLEDGNLDYIGRLDNQVKVGEFSIDVYEIENVINSIREVKSSVCVVKESEVGEKYLVAYYVVDNDDYEFVNSRSIRSYLGLYIPEYMIPTIIMRIVKIPVTHIGKVNKRELPFFDPDEEYLDL